MKKLKPQTKNMIIKRIKSPKKLTRTLRIENYTQKPRENHNFKKNKNKNKNKKIKRTLCGSFYLILAKQFYSVTKFTMFPFSNSIMLFIQICLRFAIDSSLFQAFAGERITLSNCKSSFVFSFVFSLSVAP